MVLLLTNCQVDDIIVNEKPVEKSIQKGNAIKYVSLSLIPEIKEQLDGLKRIKKEKSVQNKSLSYFELNEKKIIELINPNGDANYSFIIEKPYVEDEPYTVENLNITLKNGEYQSFITKWIPSDGKEFYDIKKFNGEVQYLDLNGVILHSFKYPYANKTAKSLLQYAFTIGCYSYVIASFDVNNENWFVYSSENICGGGGGGTPSGGGTTSGGTTSSSDSSGLSGLIGGGGSTNYSGSGTTSLVPNLPSQDEVEIKKYNTFLNSLTTTQYNYLSQNLNFNDLFFNYLLDNFFSTNSKNFEKWAINYMISNPDTSVFDLFTTRTSFDSSTGDIDNNTVGGYDNTVYSEFNPQQTPWSIIPNVIPISQFVGWNRSLHPTWQCMEYAKDQIAKKGYKISNYYDVGQTFQIYKEQTGVNQTELTKGLSYLKYALTNGIPVIVGVDDASGSPGNIDNTTDHFIVIVGMGSNSTGNYFQFYDNASGDVSQGANSANLLYYNSNTGLISGRTQCSAYRDRFTTHNYILTHIRKSKL